MEEHSRDEPPNLVFLSDIVCEFGLESVQRADPALLVALLVSHDCCVHDLSQDKHADAKEHEDKCNGLELKVGEESL